MFRVFLLNFFLIISLSAHTYEDAEDLKTNGWKVVSSEFGGEVSNVFNKFKRSRVIKLDGDGIKSIYQLVFSPNLENIKMDKSFFTWEMNYSENFVIFIVVNTIKGKRYLIYTPGDKNSYLQYGLNRKEKGTWQKYSRNLEKDLQIYEKKNKIIDIESFVIKGSGLLDNIQLKSLKSVSIIPEVKENINVPKDNLKQVRTHENDILPVLKLKGKNPVVLKLEEEYIEAGATAKNRDGTDIDIKITDNIDILTEGVYTVIYIATNKLGNSSIEKRQVLVGKKIKKENKKDKHKDDLAFPEELRNQSNEEELDQEYFDKQENNSVYPNIQEIEDAELREATLDDTLPVRPGL